MTLVLAALQQPLLPPAAARDQGQQFATQVLKEAAAVQQRLADFEDVTWPALIEAGMRDLHVQMAFAG